MKLSCVKLFLMVGALGAFLGYSSCSKSSDPALPTVKFTVKSATYNEDQGVLNIPVSLSSKAATDVTVNYSWTGGPTTFLNGDFSITSAGSSITIPAGSTSGQIQLQVIDDTQIDNTDSITFTINTVSNNAKILTANAATSLYINNNDLTPADAMQVDLTWSTGATSSINDADLGLYLQQNVTYDATNGVTDIGTHYAYSDNLTGFETLQVPSTATDQIYWVAIAYNTGSVQVNFSFLLNGFGWSNGKGKNTFLVSDVGTAFFFGPFTKTQSTFPFTGRVSTSLTPAGPLHVVKVNHFKAK